MNSHDLDNERFNHNLIAQYFKCAGINEIGPEVMPRRAV